MTLSENTRIYYGGDMANDSGLGTIVLNNSDKWGNWVNILMDDGRTMHIPTSGFSPVYKGHGGTRFVTIDAYNAYRKNGLAQMGITDYTPAK